jgi:hypothetical protein
MWCVFDRRLLGWLAVRSLYPAFTLPDLELRFVHARNLGPIHKHRTFICLAAERVFSYDQKSTHHRWRSLFFFLFFIMCTPRLLCCVVKDEGKTRSTDP